MSDELKDLLLALAPVLVLAGTITGGLITAWIKNKEIKSKEVMHQKALDAERGKYRETLAADAAKQRELLDDARNRERQARTEASRERYRPDARSFYAFANRQTALAAEEDGNFHIVWDAIQRSDIGLKDALELLRRIAAEYPAEAVRAAAANLAEGVESGVFNLANEDPTAGLDLWVESRAGSGDTYRID